MLMQWTEQPLLHAHLSWIKITIEHLKNVLKTGVRYESECSSCPNQTQRNVATCNKTYLIHFKDFFPPNHFLFFTSFWLFHLRATYTHKSHRTWINTPHLLNPLIPYGKPWKACFLVKPCIGHNIFKERVLQLYIP